MKCQILFHGKNKKNITNLSSVENAQRVVKVNHTYAFCLNVSFYYIVKRNVGLTSMLNAKSLRVLSGNKM